MSRYANDLREELDAVTASMRAEISGLDQEGLVKWCRVFIEKSLIGSNVDVEAIVFNSLSRIDLEAALNLAKEHYWYHIAFKSVIEGMRKRGKLIPKVWGDYLADLLLGVAKPPSGRGKTKARVLES